MSVSPTPSTKVMAFGTLENFEQAGIGAFGALLTIEMNKNMPKAMEFLTGPYYP